MTDKPKSEVEEKIRKLESDVAELRGELVRYRDNLLEQIKRAKSEARKEFESLEKNLEMLRTSVNNLTPFMMELSALYSDLVALYLLIETKPEAITVDRLKKFLRGLRHTIDKADPLGWKESILEWAKSVLEVILAIARTRTIPFDRIALAIIEGLGKDLAKNVVKSETVIRYYKREDWDLWTTLVGS